MITFRLALHPQIEVDRSGGHFRIRDPAAGEHVVRTSATGDHGQGVFPPDVAAFLLANGFARAPRRVRQQIVEALGNTTRSERRLIHRWGAARRFVALPGFRRILLTVVVALAWTWGTPVALACASLASVMLVLGAELWLAAQMMIVPGLIVVLVATHEAAHWLTVRHRLGPQAGALLLDWRTCVVVHAPASSRDMRLIAAAGPSAGTAMCLLAVLVSASSPVVLTTSVVLLFVNLLGFTPITGDGRALSSRSP